MRNYENGCICMNPTPLIAGSGLKNRSYNMDTFALMDFYLKGKSLLRSAMETLHQIFKIPKQELNVLFVRKILATGQKSPIVTAALDYWTGSRLITEVKKTIIERLRFLIHFVIRRKFGNYLRFQRDLFQEGVLGLLKGLEAYHPSKGEPVPCICKAIVNEICGFARTYHLI